MSFNILGDTTQAPQPAPGTSPMAGMALNQASSLAHAFATGTGIAGSATNPMVRQRTLAGVTPLGAQRAAAAAIPLRYDPHRQAVMAAAVQRHLFETDPSYRYRSHDFSGGVRPGVGPQMNAVQAARMSGPGGPGFPGQGNAYGLGGSMIQPRLGQTGGMPGSLPPPPAPQQGFQSQPVYRGNPANPAMMPAQQGFPAPTQQTQVM